MLLTENKLIKVFCIMSLLVGCGTTSHAEIQAGPKWISGSSDQYPSSQYLVGVGTSPGQGRAKEKARADLVKTIKVSIDATSKLNERVSSHETNAGTTEDIRRRFEQDIETRSQVELKNIRIADTWYSDKEEQFYALAVLARSQARDDLVHDISKSDAETARHIQRANLQNDIFDRIESMNKAVLSQVKRDQMMTYLGAIDTAAVAANKGQYDTDNLIAKKLKLQRSLPLSINAFGGETFLLEGYAKSGLTGLGYTPTTKNKTTYVLDVDLAEEKPIYRDRLYWIFAKMEVSLRNAKTNKVRGSCTWDFKEASQAKSRAHGKIMDAVKVAFDSNFESAFNSFVAGTPCENPDEE